MKKSKVVLICLAAVLVAGGSVLAAVGWEMGAYKHTDKWSIHIPFGDKPDRNSFYDGKESEDMGVTQEETPFETEEKEEFYNWEWTGEGELKKLVIEVGDAEVTLAYGDQLKVFGKVKAGDKVKASQKGGETVISTQEDSLVGYETELYITVPEGLFLNDLEIEQSRGFGVVRVNGIRTKELDVDTTGQLIFTGHIGSNADIDVSMGSVVLALEGNASEYRSEIDCARGTVQIGEDTFSGVTEQVVNPKAAKEMEIDVALGSVVIEFADTKEESHGIPESVTSDGDGR